MEATKLGQTWQLYSNTTLVKVKFKEVASSCIYIPCIQIQHLLKLNSNSWLINALLSEFKYNTC